MTTAVEIEIGVGQLPVSGQPGTTGVTIVLEPTAVINTQLQPGQQAVSALGAPSDIGEAADAGRRLVERFPHLLGRLADL